MPLDLDMQEPAPTNTKLGEAHRQFGRGARRTVEPQIDMSRWVFGTRDEINSGKAVLGKRATTPPPKRWICLTPLFRQPNLPGLNSKTFEGKRNEDIHTEINRAQNQRANTDDDNPTKRIKRKNFKASCAPQYTGSSYYSPHLRIAGKICARTKDFIGKIFLTSFVIAVFASLGIVGWYILNKSHTWYGFVAGAFLMLPFSLIPRPALDLLRLLLKVLEVPDIISRDWEAERKHEKSWKEARKNMAILLLISRDCLPISTYSRFHIAKSGRSMSEMYDTCFALLLWVWIEHCREDKIALCYFTDIAESCHPNIYRISREFNAYVSFTQKSKKSVFTFKGERLEIVLDFVSKRLTADPIDKWQLKELLTELVCNFCKANNFWLSWIGNFHKPTKERLQR